MTATENKIRVETNGETENIKNGLWDEEGMTGWELQNTESGEEDNPYFTALLRIDGLDQTSNTGLLELAASYELLPGLCGYCACANVQLLDEHLKRVEDSGEMNSAQGLSCEQLQRIKELLRDACIVVPRAREVVEWVKEWRSQYVDGHKQEFANDGAEQFFRNGMMGCFEISEWLQSDGNRARGRVDYYRFLNTKSFDEELRQQAEGFEVERRYLAQEQPFLAFPQSYIVETSDADDHPVFSQLLPLRPFRPAIVDLNGHFAVVCLLLLQRPHQPSPSISCLLHVDSLPESSSLLSSSFLSSLLRP